jgi:hypothetical protein
MPTSRRVHEYAGVRFTVDLTWHAEEELLSEDAGTLRCTQITIAVADTSSPGDVTAQVLRSIPVARLIAAADKSRRDYLALLARHPEPAPDGEYWHVWAGKHLPLPRTAGQRGRPRYWTDDTYQEVARVYSLAVAAGQPPVKAVAEALKTTPRSASKLVSKARAAGHLPPTSRGRIAGGDVS